MALPSQAFASSVFMLSLLAGCGRGSGDGSQASPRELSDPLIPSNFKATVRPSQTRMVDHCFFTKHRYFPALSPTAWSTEDDAFACQRRCASSPGCKYFTFFNGGRCVQSGEDAYEIDEPAATAGPTSCSKVAASCTDKPGPHFPGATAIESKLAWTSHRVPSFLECWPVDWSQGVYDNCDVVQELQNLSSGLPGRCTNLQQVTVPQYETCRSVCEKMAFCSTFQLTSQGCFIGRYTSGTNCYAAPGGSAYPTERAVRYLHGSVRVLMFLISVQVKGLYKIFSASDVAGEQRTTGVDACRDACYSNLLCRFWQYYIEDGCWVEEPEVAAPVPTPLTDAHFRRDFDTAIAGEYIQHFCPGLGWTPSEEWSLVASSTTCATGEASGSKDLAGSNAISVAECKRRATADEACGTTMYSNGLACFCMLKGNLCVRQPSGYDFGVYERINLLSEVQSQPAPEVLTRLAPSDERRYYVELDMLGLNYDNLVTIDGAKDRFIARCVPAVEIATGVAANRIQDTSGTEGTVSVVESVKNKGNTVVQFHLEVPASSSGDALSRSLWSESFSRSMQVAARDAAPAAITGPIRVVPSFGLKEPPPPRTEGISWLLILAIFVAILALVGCIGMAFFSKAARSPWGGRPSCEDPCSDFSDGSDDRRDVRRKPSDRQELFATLFKNDR